MKKTRRTTSSKLERALRAHRSPSHCEPREGVASTSRPQDRTPTRHTNPSVAHGHQGPPDAPPGTDGIRPSWRLSRKSSDGTGRNCSEADRASQLSRRTAGARPELGGGDNFPLEITTGAAFFRVRGFVVEGASGASTTNIYVSGRATTSRSHAAKSARPRSTASTATGRRAICTSSAIRSTQTVRPTATPEPRPLHRG